jgi:hypothetical protein
MGMISSVILTWLVYGVRLSAKTYQMKNRREIKSTTLVTQTMVGFFFFLAGGASV